MIARSRTAAASTTAWGSGRPLCTASDRLAPRLESLEVARARLADELGIALRIATAGLLAAVIPPPRVTAPRAEVLDPVPTAWKHIPTVPRFKWSDL